MPCKIKWIIYSTLPIAFLLGEACASTIYLENTENLKIKKITIKQEDYYTLDIQYGGISCKIDPAVKIMEDYPRATSDGNFLILDWSHYISKVDLEKCHTSKSINSRKYIGGQLQDINNTKKLLATYVEPAYINRYFIPDNPARLLIEIADFKKVENKKDSFESAINIKNKPFYRSRRSDKDLARSLFAGGTDRAIFSPDGNYLALLTSDISCKKGAYPGVYETTHWKQVIFTGPDSDAKCKALFPQLAQ